MESPINKPGPTSSPNNNIFHRSAFLRRVVALIIVPAAIIAPIMTIMWLVFRPEAPDFWLESFSLSNLTLSDAANNNRSDIISFASDVRLSSRNPNKRLDISYIHVDAFVFYGPTMVSRAEVPGFSQGAKSDTRLEASFSSGKEDDVEGIAADVARDGSVVIDVRMLSRIRFEAKAWATRHRYLSVLCGGVVVGVPSGGRPGGLAGGSRRCTVEI